jgi:NitT/TauT family transport system substrate-binding protein
VGGFVQVSSGTIRGNYRDVLTRLVNALALAALVTAGCRSSREAPPGKLRIGYFPTVTHAAALIALERGTWKSLPVPVESKAFGAGPEAMEALFAGALDACFVGPMPAANAFVRSHGEAIVIVAGAAADGAAFVVGKDSGITGPESLHGKRLAAPQLANTQDVALRTWLEDHGSRSRERGGDVQVMPIANPDILTLMRTGQLDGAWVPEPWVSRLVLEAGGRVLVDERDLWPNRRFPSAVLVVTRQLAGSRPELVRALVASHVETVAWAHAHPAEARALVDEALLKATHKRLPPQVLAAAFANVELTTDPMPAAIQKIAADARRLGYLPDGPVADAIDLRWLNFAASQHD